MAVQITGDAASAISCLKRLSGGDLTLPSHTWELFGIDGFPAMSYNQRITELRNCVDKHL
jgi:hypothetical protein